MDFIDHVRDLSSRIQNQASGIQTEEATKTAFMMPFIAALGYNVFDPTGFACKVLKMRDFFSEDRIVLTRMLARRYI